MPDRMIQMPDGKYVKMTEEQFWGKGRPNETIQKGLRKAGHKVIKGYEWIDGQRHIPLIGLRDNIHGKDDE